MSVFEIVVGNYIFSFIIMEKSNAAFPDPIILAGLIIIIGQGPDPTKDSTSHLLKTFQ